MPSERPAAPDMGAPPSIPPPQASVGESERPSAPPPDEGSAREKRGRFERRLPNLIRRGIEKSIEAGLYTFEKSMETGRETTDAVREVFSDVKIPDVASAVGKALQEAKLPREIATAVLGQLDDTKNDIVRIIAREVRDFLDATDLAGEIKAALTSLSFEVRTEVRFIPNDAGTGVRPDVRSRGRVKRSSSRDGSRDAARDGRKRERDDNEEDDDLDPS